MIRFAGPISQAFENDPAFQLIQAVISVVLLITTVLIVLKLLKITRNNLAINNQKKLFTHPDLRVAILIIALMAFVSALYLNVVYTQHSEGTWNYVFIETLLFSLIGIFLFSVYEKRKR